MAHDLIHQSDVKFATFDGWERISGMGKSRTYLAITDGLIKAVKLGGRTMIDVESGLAYMRSLPPAVIRIKSRPVKRPDPVKPQLAGRTRTRRSQPQLAPAP